jgi:pimeloyl-ACP methyl ester carboxylesterase
LPAASRGPLATTLRIDLPRAQGFIAAPARLSWRATEAVKHAEPESRWLDLEDVRIHYLDWGGDGQPIVILHATGFHSRTYRVFAEALRAIGRVYAMDQRGHGDSGLARSGRYNWYATMHDLAEFIEALSLVRVRGFGHSAGATAIGALACERPELVARAVLVEPVVFESPNAPELGWRNPFIERTLKRKRVFASVNAMYANFEQKPPYASWRRDILRDYCDYATRPTADGKRELKCAPEVEAKYYESSRDFDGLGRILRAERPLLVMFGASSDSLGYTLSDKIAAGLKRGRVLNVAGAGHFLPMERPELVIRESIEFLRGDAS